MWQTWGICFCLVAGMKNPCPSMTDNQKSEETAEEKNFVELI